VSLFEPRSERVQQNRENKGASGISPEINDFIMNFFQSMTQGGMPIMGGAPPMPPAPMGPARAAYAQKPPQNRGPRNDMYGRPPQVNMPSGYGPPPPMPRGFPPQAPNMMMQGQNQFSQGAPPQSVPMGMPNIQQEPQMEMMPPAQNMEFQTQIMTPPINVATEDTIYSNLYNELVKDPEYIGLSDDDKRTKFGDLIFPYAESIAGPENAPKITGMIIDLDLPDLEQATSTLASIQEKIREGHDLLAEEGGD